MLNKEIMWPKDIKLAQQNLFEIHSMENEISEVILTKNNTFAQLIILVLILSM